MNDGRAGWMCSRLEESGQEQARSGGRLLHTTEDGTLRLTEKASSCRQEMGHCR